MNAAKGLFFRYWPIIVGVILFLAFGVWLGAQDRPAAFVEFPINFSCGLRPVNDNLGNPNGYILAADFQYESQTEVSSKHFERRYVLADQKKGDDFCLELHKEFNRERDNARKHLNTPPRKAGDPKSTGHPPVQASF